MSRSESPNRPIEWWQEVPRWLVRIVRQTLVRVTCPGWYSVGVDVSLGPDARILSPNHFRAGDRVRIGANFRCETNVVIGNDVLISSRVSFIGNDHAFDDPTHTVFSQGRLPPAQVVLEGDNMIGHGTIIVGSVRVGHGVIVGAGSLITTDLPARWICFGRPARPVRPRFLEDGELQR